MSLKCENFSSKGKIVNVKQPFSCGKESSISILFLFKCEEWKMELISWSKPTALATNYKNGNGKIVSLGLIRVVAKITLS